MNVKAVILYLYVYFFWCVILTNFNTTKVSIIKNRVQKNVEGCSCGHFVFLLSFANQSLNTSSQHWLQRQLVMTFFSTFAKRQTLT